MILFLLSGGSCNSDISPGVLDISPNELSVTYAENFSARFISEADSLLFLPVLTLASQTHSHITEHSQTYVSLACYWWPDTDAQNGLPYIRKDGQVNPETRSDQSDLPMLMHMARRIEILTHAFRQTQNPRYAEKAIEQLRTWFVDKQTAMLPHLEHAQMVKGRNTGRSYGLIDTWWLVRIVESFEFLRNSESWTDELETGLKAWFTHYLNWLRNSNFGNTEIRSKNNHGTWYDVQVVIFSIFTGQEDYAAYYLAEVSAKRIEKQISPSGRQKFEMRRTRPLHYSIYNLAGLIKLALYAEQMDVPLKNHATLFSSNFELSTLYLIRKMQEVQLNLLIDELDRTDTDLLYLRLLADAWQVYQNPVFLQEMYHVLAKQTFINAPSDYFLTLQ